MRTLGVTAVLVAATTGLAALGAGPAQAADFDPATLCASATPTARQVAGALDTIADNTAAAVTAAGGVTNAYVSNTETLAYVYDAATTRSRWDQTFDDAYANYPHWIMDGVANVYYEGHKSGDDAFTKSALKALDKPRAWDKKVRPDWVPATGAEMADLAATEVSVMSILKRSTQHTVSGEHFTCAAGDGTVTFTDVYDPSAVPGTKIRTDTYVLTLDGTGALAGETVKGVGAGPWKASATWTYGPVAVGLPTTSLVSYAKWRSAYVKGSFYVLSHTAADSARAAAKKAKSHSAKVKAVRKANVKVDAQYDVTTLKRTSETNGVLTKGNRYKSTKTWWYRLKVSGSKVVLTSNVTL